MLENFIYAKQKSLFEEALNNGEVLDEAIVFIEDTKEIWNHGTYFDGSYKEVVTDLSEYIKTEDLDSIIANIEQNISNKLDNIADLETIRLGAELGSTSVQPEAISDMETKTNASITYATKTELNNHASEAKEYTDGVISDLIGNAPETLNSIHELAGALKDNKDIVTVLENSIATKVDKVTGKGLSTEDYTTEEKSKLASITVINNTADANKSVNLAIKDGSGNVITSTYATKTEVSNSLNGKVGTNGTVTLIISLTQSEYDALVSAGSVVSTTLYIITN